MWTQTQLTLKNPFQSQTYASCEHSIYIYIYKSMLFNSNIWLVYKKYLIQYLNSVGEVDAYVSLIYFMFATCLVYHRQWDVSYSHAFHFTCFFPSSCSFLLSISCIFPFLHILNLKLEPSTVLKKKKKNQ